MAEATIEVYHEDDIILKQGDPEKFLYKVMKGNVALYINYGKDDEYLVGIQSFPSCFGEMAILAGKPSYYTVVALSETQILRVPEDKFDVFIQNNPQNAIAIMKTMAKNLSLLNVNMKLLIQEVKEISNRYAGEEPAFRGLLDRCETSEIGKAMGFGKKTETKNNNSFSYLEGHREYSGITHPEYENCLIPREYICPHCGTKFEGKITSEFKVVLNREKTKRPYNLRTRYVDFNREWYQVVTCPHCYFSAGNKEFANRDLWKADKYEKQLKKAFSGMFLDFTGQKTQDFVFNQYYLALICAEGLHEKEQAKAQLWLSLSRLYEDTGDLKPAMEAARNAAENLEYVFLNQNMDANQEQKICLLIAERRYLAGDYKKAREWALKVCMHRKKNATYVDLAERLIEDVRDEEKQEDDE